MTCCPRLISLQDLMMDDTYEFKTMTLNDSRITYDTIRYTSYTILHSLCNSPTLAVGLSNQFPSS